MAEDFKALPGLLAEIEEVAGRDAALAIAAGYGGIRLKFPSPERLESNPEYYSTNWLVRTVGLEAALAIVKEIFPIGGQADIPQASAALRAEFIQKNAENLSVSEMAIFLDVNERTVRLIKSSLRDEGLIP